MDIGFVKQLVESILERYPLAAERMRFDRGGKLILEPLVIQSRPYFVSPTID